PCSATGVIRRHPDIKWLRRDRDIADLAQLQAEILNAIWGHLKPGGTLVYATCSILPEENSQQIAAFLARTPDAELDATGTPASPGQQN
ncbi:16S rRNA (cytosine(967)-C(5))-methyltransferase, partial [Acinetobacter baumannii]|nr:16S rRNA (cytosine(967)-C(5))-methyltransferase [Acinetobacter baumannii]